ncbi:hypothetical protein ABG067_006163 [Albugo candida]
MSDHIARQEITRALKEYEEAVSSQTNQIASSMTGLTSGSRLLDRVGVIVGGLSEFGYLVSLRLSQEGAKLSVVDLASRKGIGKQHETDWKIFYGESYDWDFFDTSYKTIANEFDRIDFIVNCIPIQNIPIHRLVDQNTTIQDNLFGKAAHATFLSCKRAIHQMLTQQKESICGRILNVITGHIKHSSKESFEAAVLRHLTHYIATEYGPKGILCNNIAIDSTFFPALSTCGIDQPPSSEFIKYGEDATNMVLHFVSDQIRCMKGVSVVLHENA